MSVCNVKHNAITIFFYFSKWEISLHEIKFFVIYLFFFFPFSELIFLCGNLNILSFKFLYHRNVIFKKKNREKFYRFILSFQNCSVRIYLHIIIHYALHTIFFDDRNFSRRMTTYVRKNK